MQITAKLYVSIGSVCSASMKKVILVAFSVKILCFPKRAMCFLQLSSRENPCGPINAQASC